MLAAARVRALVAVVALALTTKVSSGPPSTSRSYPDTYSWAKTRSSESLSPSGPVLDVQPVNLSVATGGKGDYAHVWEAGSAVVRLDGRSTVILSVSAAFSDNNTLHLSDARDLAVTIAFDGQDSGHAVNFIILNSTSDRLSLLLVLPAYSDGMMPCKRQPCKGNLQFHVPSFTPTMVSVVYFTYPDPEVISVYPNQGPVSGGTKIVLLVREFTGRMSKGGAGMLTLNHTMSDNWHVYAMMKCTGKQASSPVLTNTSLAGNNTEENFQIFQIEFFAPPSPCGTAGAVFALSMQRHSCYDEGSSNSDDSGAPGSGSGWPESGQHGKKDGAGSSGAGSEGGEAGDGGSGTSGMASAGGSGAGSEGGDGGSGASEMASAGGSGAGSGEIGRAAGGDRV